MSNAIAERTEAPVAHSTAWTHEQKELIKRTVCKGVTDDELDLFLYTAGRLGLDPLAKQIYPVKRWDKKAGRDVMAIQVGIDGFRLVAERSGHYAGQIGPQWCGDDGEWRDVWLSDKPPAAARVGVLRDDFSEPLWSVARWPSYVQTYRDRKTGQDVVTPFWKKMPEHMLAKVAEALALRRAFPQDLSGVYAPEEMAQADRVEDVIEGEAVETKPEPKRAAQKRHPRDQVQDSIRASLESIKLTSQHGAKTSDINAFLEETTGLKWGAICDLDDDAMRDAADKIAARAAELRESLSAA